jgi:hypothetical protein
MESLRMLESVALYKRCYLTKEAPSHTAPPVKVAAIAYI